MEPTKIIDLEKIYSHLARRLKLKNKELKVLKADKFSAKSQGEEREIYLKIVAKESEIYTIRQEIQFLDTGSIELPEEKEARLKMEKIKNDQNVLAQKQETTN